MWPRLIIFSLLINMVMNYYEINIWITLLITAISVYIYGLIYLFLTEPLKKKNTNDPAIISSRVSLKCPHCNASVNSHAIWGELDKDLTSNKYQFFLECRKCSKGILATVHINYSIDISKN